MFLIRTDVYCVIREIKMNIDTIIFCSSRIESDQI